MYSLCEEPNVPQAARVRGIGNTCCGLIVVRSSHFPRKGGAEATCHQGCSCYRRTGMSWTCRGAPGNNRVSTPLERRRLATHSRLDLRQIASILPPRSRRSYGPAERLTSKGHRHVTDISRRSELVSSGFEGPGSGSPASSRPVSAIIPSSCDRPGFSRLRADIRVRDTPRLNNPPERLRPRALCPPQTGQSNEGRDCTARGDPVSRRRSFQRP